MLLDPAEQNRSLDLYYGADKGAIASPSHEVALFNGDPTTGGTELDTAVGGYARVTITNDGTTWPAAADGAKTSAVVTFAASTGAWSDTATWFVLYPTDTGVQGDAQQIAEISVDVAGETPRTTLTIYYSGSATP